MNNPNMYCCLELLRGTEISIDLDADIIPKDQIVSESITWSDTNYIKKGLHTTVTYEYPIEYVQLENGKYAYPVYEFNGIDEAGFEDELVGWCVKESNAFNGYALAVKGK